MNLKRGALIKKKLTTMLITDKKCSDSFQFGFGCNDFFDYSDLKIAHVILS